MPGKNGKSDFGPPPPKNFPVTPLLVNLKLASPCSVCLKWPHFYMHDGVCGNVVDLEAAALF